MSLRPLIVAEPPHAYALRPALVVDASVLGAVIFPEDGSRAAQAWILGRRLFAPQLLDFEISNVACQKVRRRAVQPERATQALMDFEDLGIERLEVPTRESFALAQRYDLSGYDASYLWLASHLQAPLATFDARLGAAARRHLSGDEPSSPG